MRPRIKNQSPIAEKVYSSRVTVLNSFPMKGRKVFSNLDKLEKMQEREIKRMFKNLTVKSMMDEKSYLRTLRELPTTKQSISFLKEVMVPQNYEVIHDIILGNFKVGKNYLKQFIEETEVVNVINWNDELK